LIAVRLGGALSAAYAQQQQVAAQQRSEQSKNFCPLPILLFSFIALGIFLLADLRIADADIWFHLRNAQELLSRYSFLRQDLYTFTSLGSPLVNHEWLSELAYYLAFRAWGLPGLLGLSMVLLGLIFGGVYYLAMLRGADCGSAALVTGAGVVLGSYSFGPRMNLLGWLCLTALLIVLERFRRTGTRIWMAVPLFVLWINLHGSWPFGLIVLAIYLLAGLGEFQVGTVAAKRWTSVELRKLCSVMIVTGCGLFVNPYGYKLVWYPFELLSRQRANVENVIEWQSVDFNTGSGKLALLMILAILSAAWFSAERWELSEILLVSFALWVSLTHIRFLLFAAIILVPIVAPRVRFFANHEPRNDVPFMNLAVTVTIAVLIGIAYPSANQLQQVVDSSFPRNALSFLRSRHPSGRLLNYYDFGGYIEWNAPEIQTFADGRTDIFTYNGVFNDYIRINEIDRPLELLDKYKIDYVLFPVEKRLTYLLDKSPGWRSIYADKVAKVYERALITSTNPH
jgi:hypothetical protein